jgi:hypothetical protein
MRYEQHFHDDQIMEYMALGKPIVQFDLKEGRYSAGAASLYADNDSQVPDFAAKILWLLDHPEERKRMGESGRRRAGEVLAWMCSVPPLLATHERCFAKSANLTAVTRAGVSRDTEVMRG